MTATWTEERVARLCELQSAGWSASKIAADLGGITRNAVIGKLHRMDISGSRVDIEWTPERDATLQSMADDGQTRTEIAAHFGISQRTLYTHTKALGIKVKPNYPVASPKTLWRRTRRTPLFLSVVRTELPPAPNPFTLKLVDLKDWQCRFPAGDDSNIRFCGGHKHRTSEKTYSYCAKHCRMAYRKDRPPAQRNYAKTFTMLRGYA